MDELQNTAFYLFVTKLLKIILEQGLITEVQYEKIDRYNAEYYNVKTSAIHCF